MTIFVTGGAGFIGANFVFGWIAGSNEPVVNLNNLTHTGNLENLASLQVNPRRIYVRGDIGDSVFVGQFLAEQLPRAVVNFAAAGHVGRSIYGPSDFIQSNAVGTFHLLESVRWYRSLSSRLKLVFVRRCSGTFSTPNRSKKSKIERTRQMYKTKRFFVIKSVIFYIIC